MTGFAIRARFPLGYFVGHRGAGQVADFPDTARLFSALVHAASKGSAAEVVGGDLKPSSEGLAALQWLEAHPPSALALPRTIRMNTRSAATYRAEGVFAGKSSPTDRKVLKPQSDGIAADGPFGWIWEEEVPSGVADILTHLCADVSCLGETDAPVVLDTEVVDVTHALDRNGSAFATGAKLTMPSPVTGRFDELEADHNRSRPAKAPSVSRDGFAWGALPGSHVPSRAHVRDLVYRPLDEPTQVTPWPRVITVPFDGDFDVVDRVPLCVAVHRALVANLGDDAPAFITGRYGAGAKQPPNRLAIHLLEAGHPGITEPSIGLLIPPGVDDADLAALARAIRGVRRVWVRRSKVSIELDHSRLVDRDAAEFWSEPAPEKTRFWLPSGALVPEVRRQKTTKWTLADAAMLSVAFMCRENLGAGPLTGKDRYTRLVAAAARRGVRAHRASLVNDSRAGLYAHKMPDGVPATPYRAWVEMGDTVPPRALFALGQSRHLGGGLMLPVDLDSPTAHAMGLTQ